MDLSDITSGEESDQEEPEWTRVSTPKSMEEMEKEIGKGKSRMGKLEEWNLTLKGIMKKRQASCKERIFSCLFSFLHVLFPCLLGRNVVPFCFYLARISG